MSNLTAKQEKFCQEYIKTGNKSEAYRRAYNASNMKPETINETASKLFYDPKISTRVQELQKEVADRNKITVDECVSLLASLARFDIANAYNEDGTLKPLHQIDKDTRLAIESLETDERLVDGMKVGDIRKIKTASRRGAIIELMKHLGGYEKDNEQRQPKDLSVTVSFRKFSEDGSRDNSK